jgi:hypothetical protein
MKHLMFLFVDHFEPETPEDLFAWVRRYPKVVKSFLDADGRHPQHSWFYDREDGKVLESLSGLCARQLGEIEIHLHHGHDTSDGLREKLQRRKRAYGEHGALARTQSGDRAFAFIHGKWCLDNSRGDAHCGVNDELIVLREAGCYADFTFPAWGAMQPRKRNSIYYATDDPDAPKSYDTGVDVEVGSEASGDLMIMQGPGHLSGIPRKVAAIPGAAWLADRIWLTCGVDGHMPLGPGRIDRWVSSQVCVKGRPDWLFVKVHTHGARPSNYEPYFGPMGRRLHSHLTTRYNDGQEWALHYVTARESYNIIKAAEAGESGDPGNYRDYTLAPPENSAG